MQTDATELDRARSVFVGLLGIERLEPRHEIRLHPLEGFDVLLEGGVVTASQLVKHVIDRGQHNEGPAIVVHQVRLPTGNKTNLRERRAIIDRGCSNCPESRILPAVGQHHTPRRARCKRHPLLAPHLSIFSKH